MDAREPSPLDDLGLRPFYDLYRILATKGISPGEADGLELWEIAAVLGIEPGSGTAGGLDERIEREATPEQMARRVARAHIKPRRSSADPPNDAIPEPEPKQAGEDLTDRVMRQMGIRTR